MSYIIHPTDLFDSVIDKVACYLPKGYEITIELERGSGSVKLTDRYGDAVELPPHGDGVMDELNAAVGQARYLEGMDG